MVVDNGKNNRYKQTLSIHPGKDVGLDGWMDGCVWELFFCGIGISYIDFAIMFVNFYAFHVCLLQ